MHWLETPPPKRGVRITFTGDWAPTRAYEAPMVHTPAAVYGDLLPLFNESDLNIVNVECVLGDCGTPIPKAGPALRGPAEALGALAPFQIAALANNHSMDYGAESLAHTLRLLQSAGLQTLGAGNTAAQAAEPLKLQPRGGPSLGILNYAEAEACAALFGGPGANVYEAARAEAEVAALREEVEAVLVIFHGGREHAAMPPPYVVTALRRLARAGATAIIAHHPHVPQGVEVYEGTPIAYSLGNFLFDPQSEVTSLRTGYLAHLDFEGARLAAASLTPYRLGASGVQRLAGAEERAFRAHLARLSRLLADPEAVEAAWCGFIDTFGDAPASIVAQLERGLRTYAENPLSGAARLHHYFFCPAHREYFQHAFARLARGRFGDAPEWARQLALETRTRTTPFADDDPG